MSKEQIIDEVYKNYLKHNDEVDNYWIKRNPEIEIRWKPYSQEEFINKCKTDPEFSEKWGLKIEERELSLEERKQIVKNKYFIEFYWKIVDEHNNENTIWEMNKRNIPTKLITLTYNNETIESYE